MRKHGPEDDYVPNTLKYPLRFRERLDAARADIDGALKAYPNYDGCDFTDVNADGIQIRGFHKLVGKYCYGAQVTIAYDFSDFDEKVREFIELWPQFDTPEQVKTHKHFIEQGEKYGWD